MVVLSPKFVALGVVLFGSAFSSVAANQFEDSDLVARELEAFGASISARHAMGVIEAREPAPENPSSLAHVISFREFHDEGNDFDAREEDDASQLVARDGESSLDAHTISFREVDEESHLAAREEPSSLAHTISFRELDSELVERSEDGSDLETREFHDTLGDEEDLSPRSVEDNVYDIGDVTHLNSRSFDEDEELFARGVEDNVYEVGDVAHLNSRSFDDDEELFARGVEDNVYEVGDVAHLNSRSFDDEDELFARSLEEDDELVARGLEEDEELFARGVEDNVYEVGDVAHLNSRMFDDEEELFARGLGGDEVDLD